MSTKASTVDQAAYRSRTGSHGTKPFKTGSNEHLAERSYDVEYSAENEAERVKNHNDLVEQRMALGKIKAALQRDLEDINRRLTAALPYKEYTKLKDSRNSMAAAATKIEIQIRDIKRQLRGHSIPRAEAFDALFKETARVLLPKDVFAAIHDAVVRQMFGPRPPDECGEFKRAKR